MKLYARYLLKSFLLTALLVLPLLAGIYALVEFFDKLDNITKAKLPLSYLLYYILMRLPEIFLDLWPIGLSLAALLSFAFLARGGELLAFRTLGFSPARLIWPYLWASLFLSLIFVGALEKVLPRAAYEARFFWETKVRHKEPKGLVLRGKLYFRGVNSFFVGQVISNDVRRLKDVVYVRLDSKGLPLQIIWAKEAFFSGREWIFREGVMKERGDRKPRWFSTKTLALEFSPETVLVVKRTPRLQSLKDLWEQRNFLLKAGLPALQAESEIAYRLFYPFLAVALILWSLPSLLLQKGKQALGKGLTLGVLGIAGGLGIFLLAKNLGDAGYVSPLLIQPGALLAMFATGLFYLFKVRT
ncbi:MAG: YjgP/YjgQ family permease [Thermodesulfobacteria bacterium]|nr:YjgP/YjgQ family permease [Thermodesulfobacteriota bacterium]